MIAKIIIAVLTFFVAVFMLFEKIIKNEKKPTGFEYLIFFMLLISAGATSYQILEDYDKEIKSINDNSIEQERIQKTIQKGIDSGIIENNKLLAEAFKKQNIDIDSLKQVLQLIKNDTSRNKWLTISEINPDVDFQIQDGIKFINRLGDYYNYRVSIVCSEAKATSVEVKLHLVILTANNGYVKVNEPFILGDVNTSLSKDNNLDVPIKLLAPLDDSIKVLFVVAKGKYKNLTMTKSYPLYSVRIFEMSERKYGVLAPQSYPNVRRFLVPQ